MRPALPASLVLLVACGPGGSENASTDTDAGSASTSGATSSTSPEVDTKPWDIETETNPPPEPTTGAEGGSMDPTLTATVTGPPPTTDGGEDTVGEEEDFVGMVGFGLAMPGTSYEQVEGEAIVFEAGVDECVLIWSATAVVDDTCAECQFAYRLTIAVEEVEADESCADYGLDPTEFDGSQLAVGLSMDDSLYVDDGAGYTWRAGSFGEYIEDEGVFEWEYPLD